MPAGTKRLRGGTVIVHLHAPVDAPPAASREEEKHLMEDVRNIIATDVDSQS